MNCPFCGGPSQVKDSRPTTDGVRRRRECKTCHRRFTTFEELAQPDLRVLKADGSAELFEEAKLQRTLLRVCRDRPVREAQVRALARRLEAELMEEGVTSVKSSELARRVHGALEPLDLLAAERFAINYRDASGQVRFERRPRPVEEDPPQLGLFAEEDDEDATV